MNLTESLSQGLQIGEKAVNLHPVIDGFRVLLFTFWMNSFAFPWKFFFFLIYNLPLYSESFIQYISSEVIIVFHSSFKTIFNDILKSLTQNEMSFTKIQQHCTLSLQYYSFSCPSSFSQEIKSFSLLFLCFNNSELTNYVTRVPGQFFCFES